MKPFLRRWIDRWNTFWFPQTNTLPLAVARIIALVAQLFWFYPALDLQLEYMQKNPDFIKPELLIRGLAAVVPHSFFTPSVFTAFYWGIVVFGVLALVGLFTRTSLFIFALGQWILTAHLYSYGDRHHRQAIFCIFLLSLAFAPSGRALSVDALIRRWRARQRGTALVEPEVVDTAIWPLKLAQLLLGISYLETGVSKLLFGGLRWMNGYTLQTHILRVALPGGFPAGIWLAQHHTIAIVLSVFTIAFESLFFLSLFFPRLAPLFFLSGIFFQIGLYVTGGHNFFQHITLLFILLVTLTPEYWGIRVRPWELLRWRQPAELSQPAT